MVYTDYMGWTGPWSTSGDASKSDGWVTSAMRTCSRRCTTETAPAGPSSIVYQFYCTGGYWISTFPVCEPVSLHLPCNVQTIKKKDDRVFFIYNTSTRAVVIFASCRSNGIGLYNNTIYRVVKVLFLSPQYKTFSFDGDFASFGNWIVGS